MILGERRVVEPAGRLDRLLQDLGLRVRERRHVVPELVGRRALRAPLVFRDQSWTPGKFIAGTGNQYS